MFKAQFGNHIILYNAKVDGILSEEPVTDTLIGKTCKLVGMKTFRVRSGITSTSPLIVSRCWSTNYLIDADKVVIGYKNVNNVVKSIKEFSVNNVLKISKVTNYNLKNCITRLKDILMRNNLPQPYCDGNKCKLYLKKFLDDIEEIITRDYDENIYKFIWKVSNKIIKYTEHIPDDEILLKTWFINKAEEYKRTHQT